MPNASYVAETVKVELKSCLGGWVELRQLDYAQILKRRDQAGKIRYEGSGKSTEVTQDMMLSKLAEMDFRLCIVDHNLYKDDAETDKYDFTNPASFASLNPRIGEEINTEINKLNQFDEDEAKNSVNGSGPA